MSVEKHRYNACLANYFSVRLLFFDGDLQKKPNIRKGVELPFQQTKAELWDEVIHTLCDLDFIQAKACTKQTHDLMADFNRVFEALPENQVEINKEKKRKNRIDIYTQDLIKYSNSEIEILEVPKSITPWSQDQIEAELERIKSNPKRINKLQDFYNFLSQEYSNIQNFASDFSSFTIQQAWNYAREGLVSNAADVTSHKILNSLLLYPVCDRPKWNLFSPVFKIFKGNHFYSITLGVDCKQAVSASSDGRIFIWNVESGQILRTFIGNGSNVDAIGITPDYKFIVTGSKDSLWDVEKGTVIHTPVWHSQGITSINITPNGKYLFSCPKGKDCIVWDVERMKVSKILHGHSSEIKTVSITPNGKRVITGSMDKTCIVWNLEKEQSHRTLIGHKYGVHTVDMTPDGKLAISASYDDDCILWDLESGKPLMTTRMDHSKITAICITPDGRYAIIGTNDGICSIWDLQSGQVIKTIRGHSSSISSLNISPDCKYAYLSYSNHLMKGRIFVIIDLERSLFQNSNERYGNTIQEIRVTPNKMQALIGTIDKSLTLLDLETSQAKKTLKEHSGPVTKIGITYDGKKVVSSSSELIVWDFESVQVLKRLSGHEFSVTGLSITPDGRRVFTGSYDFNCIIWDIESGQVLKLLKEHISGVTAVCIAPDGKFAISGSRDKTCIIWDLESGQALKILKGHNSEVISVCFSPDNRLAVSNSNDRTCIVWDISSGQSILILKADNSGFTSPVYITPNGRYIITGSFETTFIVWEFVNGEVFQIPYEGSNDELIEIKITPDGNRAVSLSFYNSYIIWDFPKLLKIALFPSTFPTSLIETFDNGIISGGFNGKIAILNVDPAILCPGPGILTIRYIWDFDLKQFIGPTGDCPMCGTRFSAPSSIIGVINEITQNVKLKPKQSACLRFPKEAWNEPRLLSECPNCNRPLKYNPFIVDNRIVD